MKVTEVVKGCLLTSDSLSSAINLNILPLGSYYVLIDMDWLENHCTKLDRYNNFLECLDDAGNPLLVKGVLKKVSIMQVTTLQLGRYF